MTPSDFTPEQIADLQGSGLTPGSGINAGLYCERDGDRVRDLLGSYLSVKTARGMGPCLVIPYWDPAGKPMSYRNGDGVDRPFVRLKPTKPRIDKAGRKVKYVSPAGASPRAYFPPGTRAAVLEDSSIALLVTEGEKKSLCADQHGFRCVGLGGVSSWSVKREKDADGKGIGPRELIPDLAAIAWQGRMAVIVYDSDLNDKPEVQWERWHLSEAIRERGADVRVIDLPASADGGKCGLDDYLLVHGPDSLRKLIEAARPPTRPVVGDPRPKIVIGTDEYRVNMEAIAALAPMADLYQRGGLLCRVVRMDADSDSHSAVRRTAGSPVVRPFHPALLRERMTRASQWVIIRGRGEKSEEVPSHPPHWCVSAVHSRENWPLVRHLEAVVDHPVVLSDGSVLAANGYDRASRLLVTLPHDLSVSVPDTPTRSDVEAAVRLLNDVIADFPFEKPEHRAVFYAGLLTPLAWFGFEGPAPMTLIDGNTRGVGKGLLADVIGIILTGRRFPVMSYSADKEELRKKVTSLAMEGERLVLLDNLSGGVGNDVLDMALTADRWKDRILGVNKVYDGPLHVNWYATGNNVQLNADTSRRCSHCRLESELEKPELRADVRYPDLRKHLREHRGLLLSAALTILRGWCAAGRPRHGLSPWGSFEGWSGVVREAVVFAGLPDPGETRMSLQTRSDRDAVTMSALIDALERADPGRQGLTTAEIIDHIRKPAEPVPAWNADLKSAVEELCGRLDGRILGYRFRHFARRNFAGKMIDRAAAVSSTNSIRWTVYRAGAGNRPGPSPASPVSPATPNHGLAGDTGDTGDASAQVPTNSVSRPARLRFCNNDGRREK